MPLPCGAFNPPIRACPLDLCGCRSHWAYMRPNPLLAALLICFASIFVAAATLLAKALGIGSLGAEMHPLQITWGRYAFGLLVILMATALLRPRLTRPHWGLHGARTTAGMVGVTLMFAAVAYIPLADATAISFLNPVFAVIFAMPLLGERVGPIRWLATAVALTGAVILLRPGTGSFQLAALLALGAAVALGFELTVIKQLAARERPLQVLLVNNLTGVALASIAVVFVWRAPLALEWAAFAGIGACMAVAQTCYINAMARAEASFVAPFGYLTLVFATLFDRLVYAARPDFVTWLGAGTIIAGAALLGWREALAQRR